METKILSRVFSRVVLPLITIGAVMVAVYFYNQVRILKQDPQSASRQEVAALISKVGKLVLLPEGETPTVATISDPEMLKDQPFFAKAVVGDKVLIYNEAKKAILYSVAINKVVDISALNLDGTKGANSSTGQ